MTIQDVYNVLGVLGFLLSALLFVLGILKSRERYTVCVIDHAMRTDTIMQLLVSITNQSDRPLVITSISCGQSTCELEPKKIRGNPGQIGFAASARFPLCVPPQGCSYAYLEFQDYQHTPAAPGINLTLEIHSTHKVELKTVSLGNISRYLHTKEQLLSSRDSQQRT